MIEITPSLALDDSEIQLDFIRASGPGGQNVNKVATAVQLRFDIHNSPSLAPEVKARLIKLAGSRLSNDGILIIEARRYRTQDQNRTDAVQRLIALLQKASQAPQTRHATHPTLASQLRRIESKRKRSQQKKLRHLNND
jgi:ribosome-associated protein